MPWVLILRWVVRVATGLIFWRVATSRRRPYTTPASPGRTTQSRRVDRRAAVLRIREGVSLGWRAVTTLTLAIFMSLLVDAGVSLVVLSPRWLGGLLLGLAVIAAVALYVESRSLWAALRERRRRVHDDRLRHEL